MRHGDAVGAVCATTPKRDIIEMLQMRAHLLAGEERALLEAYLERGNSLCQIGRLMGLHPRNVGRKIRRIVRRLTDDTYEICLGHHDEFNGRELKVIRDHFIGGLSERCISRDRNVTLYRVRATLLKARRYARSVKTRNAGHAVHPAIRNPQSTIEGAFDGDV